MAKGKIIVIEGTDGSGKQVQSKLLCERLNIVGKTTVLQSFPNYESPSSGPVKMYLNGELSERAEEIDAYQSSVLFAVDRFCTMKKWREVYENGGIIVLDRYVQSNMIHQACKISNLEEREKFLNWLDKFEFGLLKLPKPDKIFFLDVPPKVSQALRETRAINKNGEAKDIHEQDAKYLENAYNAGKWVSEKYGWERIDCVDENGKLKSIENIHNLIYNSLNNHKNKEK